MKKTLLLVFIHGFKGDDATFHNFPKDLRALLSHSLPNINVLSVQYPKYETRGDLRECVARLVEWLQNKVIDLEVANGTPSPTVDPSVHVVLCGHSMGGIVAAEALLSIARDDPVPHSDWNPSGNNTTTTPQNDTSTPPSETSRLFFPYIRAVLAFDTPYLGISPGVLAHGAEEQINHASTAYKAFDTATNFFGWNSPKSTTPIANASTRGLPAPEATPTKPGGWGRWGKVAAFGGAAAALAGVAGAAYLNWNQINQGLAWAGSHLEFVGCLARGAELQKRVEKLVRLTQTYDLGFANFYGALGGRKGTNQTKHAGKFFGGGEERTFCVIPKNNNRKNDENGNSATANMGTKHGFPSTEKPSPKRRKLNDDNAEQERLEAETEQVREFAKDSSKGKGTWIRCCNQAAKDEVAAHTAMFAPDANPDYHAMLPRARDQIVEWIDMAWYEESGKEGSVAAEESTTGGDENEHVGEEVEDLLG
ncbi:uncharacterized protein MYCFIDRAFT_213871 [Pseudocercospora fijiensis CIRAD86]|uniref:AB hydrolase-1 domain-containing protein n=1 Tax=Pseudocercospora fijiensis (strain CIRAD86) TaxID=383855 RepID=M3B806_PSEFD|nr:uncharacterized protein MYCFIDRAFT_213871 [Pseudocercospora fijiensis CIRAD86]EME85453.1 hypothetical protein MYCFIDRAFT_213871 [Pseudocercospora fijiensis CIRAD86]